MKEKIKGILAGLIYRIIVILTFGQISPLLGAGIILEQDGKILLIDRSDGLGYTIPGGIVRHKETVEQCVLREAFEETGYTVKITGLVGVYSSLKRDPRFRAVAIAYKGVIHRWIAARLRRGRTLLAQTRRGIWSHGLRQRADGQGLSER